MHLPFSRRHRNGASDVPQENTRPDSVHSDEQEDIEPSVWDSGPESELLAAANRAQEAARREGDPQAEILPTGEVIWHEEGPRPPLTQNQRNYRRNWITFLILVPLIAVCMAGYYIATYTYANGNDIVIPTPWGTYATTHNGEGYEEPSVSVPSNSRVEYLEPEIRGFSSAQGIEDVSVDIHYYDSANKLGAPVFNIKWKNNQTNGQSNTAAVYTDMTVFMEDEVGNAPWFEQYQIIQPVGDNAADSGSGDTIDYETTTAGGRPFVLTIIHADKSYWEHLNYVNTDIGNTVIAELYKRWNPEWDGSITFTRELLKSAE